jgi:uncharacterized protein (TIGR02996 family)
MTVETGFVRSLQDDPFDETVRQIFGDWLEEQGDPEHLARRRLLALQAELTGWVPDLHARRELQTEEQALLARHGTTWLGNLPSFTWQTRFRAGLVDVTFEAGVFLSKKFLTSAAHLFDTTWIGRVHLDLPATFPDSLPTCPALAHVRQLDLGGAMLSDDALTSLLKSPHLKNLVVLDLSNNRLTDRSAEALAQAPLPHLQELAIRNNRLTRAGVQALLDARELPALRRLEVHGNLLPASSLLEAHALATQRNGIPLRAGLPTRHVNSVGMEFALIPAGTFLMGSPESEADRGNSEGPIHEVELTRPFYLGLYPVTQRQYTEVVGSNPSHFTVANGGGLEHPVEMVTWANAAAFCELLSQRDAEEQAGRIYRLPTEAQWEHACRAGTITPFCFGAAANSTLANFDGRHPYGAVRPGPYLGRTSIIGAYPLNDFGVYDLHGNVWEWCADFYHEGYYTRRARRDPTGPREGSRVSVRGGSWSSFANLCRSATRDYWYGSHYCRDNIGFRVALLIAPGSPSSR